jgi:hypothetical protein
MVSGHPKSDKTIIASQGMGFFGSPYTFAGHFIIFLLHVSIRTATILPLAIDSFQPKMRLDRGKVPAVWVHVKSG